ncbi:MAG: NUDIX hydrolase [Candidatus Omnitrophica bacterium]|nr:NUDIX hydrolase [Candidatus Omnitrophota bacterium]
MTGSFVRPNVTADMLIPNARGEFLLIRRKNEPFAGCYAIPGGFLEVHHETVEQCAIREAEEETGLRVEIDRLIGVYSDPQRDPRWHNVTAAYLAKPVSMEQARAAQAGDDAGELLWIDPRSEAYHQLAIAFDHRQIIADALKLLSIQESQPNSGPLMP